MTVESDSLGMFSLAVSIAQAIELYCPGNKILLYNIDAMTVESGSLGRFSLAISTVQAIGFYCRQFWAEVLSLPKELLRHRSRFPLRWKVCEFTRLICRQFPLLLRSW